MGSTQERPGDVFHWIPLDGEEDLVAVGGDLGPDQLLAAYRRGVFPWYEEGSPILWWSPDPRAILDLAGLRISRRLARRIRSGRFRVSFDTDFAAVIRGCARARAEGTWITADMIEAYARFHELGHAHSVETWLDDRLVGGLYGISIGGLFAAESMFYLESDASMVALAALVERLRQRGFALLDLQILNEHTARIGAVEIPRREYLQRLREAIRLPVSF